MWLQLLLVEFCVTTALLVISRIIGENKSAFWSNGKDAGIIAIYVLRWSLSPVTAIFGFIYHKHFLPSFCVVSLRFVVQY